ncbi:MAG: alpha/beta hydrolase [Bacteroidales bacterium]
MKRFPTIHSFILILLICGTGLRPACSQDISPESICGHWLGALEVNTMRIRLIFNISLKDGQLAATMDSPDQGAKGVPMTGITFEDPKLVIEARNMMGKYSGEVVSDTLIKGSWSQAGRDFPLDLIRQADEFVLNRPQEPRPPFPYLQEEIIAEDAVSGARLAGTLTIPEGPGPFPAVVLISGSGQQNRNEELLGHKPFLVLADYLTRQGIAVIRYDDRGVGGSTGDLAAMTTETNADDALAVLRKIRSHPKIDPNRTGLLGHSEGGLIAPMLASKTDEVAFIILLGGPGVPGYQVLIDQARLILLLGGMEESEVERTLETNLKIYEVLVDETDNQKAYEKIKAVIDRYLTEQNLEDEKKEKLMNEVLAGLPASAYNWLRYFIITDPADFLVRVKVPVLAIFGEKDLQVSPELNAGPMEEALKKAGNQHYTIKVMPGLNHLMQTCTTGLPAEYGEIEETMSPVVLKMIAEWVLGIGY